MITFSNFVNQVLKLDLVDSSDKLNLAVCKTATYYNCLSSKLLVTYTLDNGMFTITNSESVTGQGNTLDNAVNDLMDKSLDKLIAVSLN